MKSQPMTMAANRHVDAQHRLCAAVVAGVLLTVLGFVYG